MIKTAQTNIAGPMDKAEAQAITDRIRNGLDNLSQLVSEAHSRRAWKAMNYKTWEAYVQAEFDMTRRTSYRLLVQADVVKELSDFVPTAAQISQRDAEVIKAAPDAVIEIRERVEAGEEPKMVIDEVVKAKREEKSKKATLPSADPEQPSDPKTKPAPEPEEAQDEDERDALISELKETIAALEKENAELKAENKKFADIKMQYDRGGFEQIIANKDEVIRAQATRIERESGEKVRNLNTSEMWRKRAIKAGYSDDIYIDIETGEEVSG